MVRYNNTRTALYRPEKLPAFPQAERVQPFEPAALTWSFSNAWWLANFAHLAYCEPEQVTPQLREGMRLLRFYRNEDLPRQDQSTEAMLIDAGDYAVLSFRGTQPGSVADVKADADARLVVESGVKVHRGFLKALDEVWDRIASDLESMRDKPLWFTGHSLGAALATLAATRFPPTAVMTFGSPRVGNQAFADRLSSVSVFRVVNCSDAVARVPPGDYRHSGECHFFDHHARHHVSAAGTFWTLVRAGFRYHFTGQSLRWGNVLVRSFADHSIINYRIAIEATTTRGAQSQQIECPMSNKES